MSLRIWAVAFVLVATSSIQAKAEPLKVYLLVGQSNMQGHAHVRTLPHLDMVENTRALHNQMVGEDGRPRVCENVWIASLSSDGERSGPLTAGFGANEEKIGPELAFGCRLSQQSNGPVLLIKCAWGGKSLHTDFRPPSAGPYRFNDEQRQRFLQQGKSLPQLEQEKTEASGHYYRLTVQHVQKVLSHLEEYCPDYDSDAGYQLGGVVWFQGWNDMVDRGVYPTRDQPGGYDAYSDLLAHLIRDVRRDLSAPKLPVVIGVMGVGGPTDAYGTDQQRYRATHQNFRDAMAAPAKLPEFQGNVKAVLTEAYWDDELTKLRVKENQINQRIKQQKKDQPLSRQEEQDLRHRYRSETLTSRERVLLDKGISNAEYHYLGSARILSRIGAGFADAIMDLGKSGATQ